MSKIEFKQFQDKVSEFTNLCEKFKIPVLIIGKVSVENETGTMLSYYGPEDTQELQIRDLLARGAAKYEPLAEALSLIVAEVVTEEIKEVAKERFN